MEVKLQNNLLDVDVLVESFMKNHSAGIKTMHHVYYKTDNQLSLDALKLEITNELRTGCTTFLNKGSPIEELNPYLFYIANAFCKKNAAPVIKKITEYICPGCLFLNKETTILLVNNIFKCEVCSSELEYTTDAKKIALLEMFSKHSKMGYHCNDCDRYIPQPLDNASDISCSYFDCCFVGSWHSLKKMHHPSIKKIPEKTILDSPSESGASLKNSIVSNELRVDQQMEIKEALDDRISMLHDVIDFQSGNVPYSSSDFTVKHKTLVYEAFSNLLEIYPEEMVDYLLNQSRSGGFQHKVFQEYIRLLETSLPYNIKKGNKLYKIESLLDDTLSLFDGISVFNNIVDDKLSVKNNTQEYYFGGRKASYAKPFYIGKLLSISNKKTGDSLLENVMEYSFSKIKMKDIDPGIEVTVTHLRIPPHYQMGGMVYVNRVRKKIIDRASYLLNKENNV